MKLCYGNSWRRPAKAGIIHRAKDITILKTFNIFQILNNSIGLILKKLLN